MRTRLRDVFIESDFRAEALLHEPKGISGSLSSPEPRILHGPGADPAQLGQEAPHIWAVVRLCMWKKAINQGQSRLPVRSRAKQSKAACQTPHFCDKTQFQLLICAAVVRLNIVFPNSPQALTWETPGNRAARYTQHISIEIVQLHVVPALPFKILKGPFRHFSGTVNASSL